MTISLIGEVVNSADATTGFNQGNISGDDDFVEGTGAIGLKCSNTTCQIATTSLGAGAPYDFSVGGPEEGFHIIMWFNTKTPINASGGIRIGVADNGAADFGEWFVDPAGFYKGGFITKVIDTAADFDNVTGFTVGGNPAQLTNIDAMGGTFVTITSIMGSFNNVQLDQFTIGLGLRADGTGNDFETVRSADEDTNFWGWWSSQNGAFVGKGKLFIGPATGSATCDFSDSAFAVVFADERVAVGFYEFSFRGAGTDIDWTLANISAANPANARWSLTDEGDVNSFIDTDGVWSGADIITLDTGCTLLRTTLVDCTQLLLNGGTLDSITVLAANTADGVAFIVTADPSDISDSDFTFSDGHAIEITATGTYSFVGNTFNGYGADASNDAAIYNNSGGLVTLNVSGGGDTPTVRNGAGASTVINNNVALTITGLRDNTEVRVFTAGTTTELDGVEAATDGSSDDRSVTFSLPASATVDIRFAHGIAADGRVYLVPPANAIEDFTWPTATSSLPVTQIIDRNFDNP